MGRYSENKTIERTSVLSIRQCSHGRPFMWIAHEDVADLLEEVRTMVEQDADSGEA